MNVGLNRQLRDDVISHYRHVAVLGAGAWGTALAVTAREAGRDVTLWAREPDVVQSIAEKSENARFLPGVSLPAGIVATAALEDLAAADAILLVAPAQHLRGVLSELSRALRPGTPLVVCAKGIELGTGRMLHEVVAQEAPGAEVAVLSGPSFAHDVARGMPTAVTVAARLDVARKLQESLARPHFRPYATDDVVGTSLGGAAKNVYAIACGLAEGLGLGESARAALLARGFAELLRFGMRLGVRPETLMGLSGLGDLSLTATSRTSRNFDYGYRLAAGIEAAKGPGEKPPLAEGAATAAALVERAHAEGVELPIAHTVADILSGKKTLRDGVGDLLRRPRRDE